ncbi:Rna polymerase sigma factor sigf protein [Thalictrum thalictroides]|uniref:RNA polymerase sigma factor n=1 Tax=Thalictrum thalictroides TaxID=46969 RepID=A0A7J6WWG3_THATH|nr:Rna polymerase sigma factor sigf protein [Thalictrum thalictroides]
MEAGKQLIPSPPLFLPKTHLRNSLSSSVTMLHEQATPAVTSSTSTTQHFPTSVLLQEQRDEFRPFLHIKDDKNSQVVLEKKHADSAVVFSEEKKILESDQYIKDFERQLLYWPGSLFPSSYPGEKQLISNNMPGTVPYKNETTDVEPSDALSLAMKAVIASKEAASLVKESNLLGDDLGLGEPFLGLESTSSTTESPLDKQIKVRSGRLLARRAKKRGVSKPKVDIHEAPRLKMVDMHRKMNEDYDPNDPLRLFLSGSGTRQLLTAKEELELFVQIQELARLEEVKRRLQSQFGREPTLAEWAEVVGMSCLVLQSHLHSGYRSRERMTCANFRLVVHVAKHYHGWGMNLQDLLQEGSKGLMRSIEKFKPQAGCRFSTYAYWWIRQSIRKSIFQNSRTIRLPENVYNILRQIKNAKRECIQEGHEPTNEELARRIGITVEKLTSLLVSTKTPLSMQQPVWADQNTTFQEITADTEVESPDQCVAKQLMRQHVRNFLNILTPKEKRIIRLRFGIEDGKQNSLSQIGLIYGISKERVRQIESRALDKLKRCLSNQGLEAYSDLLY